MANEEAVMEILRQKVERLEEEKEHLERELKAAEGKAHEPGKPAPLPGDVPERGICLLFGDTATGHVIQPYGTAMLEITHDGNTQPAEVRLTAKGKPYFFSDLAASVKGRKPNVASLQIKEFRDANCVHYGSPVINFAVPEEGEQGGCCCIFVPATAQAAATCTVGVKAFDHGTIAEPNNPPKREDW